MTMPALTVEPPKLAIFNVSTSERLDAQFNPQEFQFQLQANYTDLSPPGAGYQPSQYSFTSNGTMPIDLYFFSGDDDKKKQRDYAERFLLSLCFPRRGAGNVLQHPPPRVMIVWPRYARLVCTVRQLDIQVTRWDGYMNPLEETFRLTVHTVSDGQIFSEDVMKQGIRRPSPRAVGSSGLVPGTLRGLPEDLRGR